MIQPYASADDLFELQVIPLSHAAYTAVGSYPIFVHSLKQGTVVVDRYAGISCVSAIGEVLWRVPADVLGVGENNPVRYAYLNPYSGHYELSHSKSYGIIQVDSLGKIIGRIPIRQPHDNAAATDMNARVLEVSGYGLEQVSLAERFYRLALTEEAEVRSGIEPSVMPFPNRRHYAFDYTLIRWRDTLYYTRPYLNTLYRVDPQGDKLIPRCTWNFAAGQPETNVYEDRHVTDALEYIADRGLVQPIWVVGDQDRLFASYDYHFRNNFAVATPDSTLINTSYLRIDNLLVPAPQGYAADRFFTVYSRDRHDVLQQLLYEEPAIWRERLQELERQENGIPTGGGMLALYKLR